MNSCISHNLLVTVSRSQTQAVFKKVTANPCKGKYCLFRKAWSQALVKGNPKPAPLCFSGGGQDARSGISLFFSACQHQCAQCLQKKGPTLNLVSSLCNQPAGMGIDLHPELGE